jgi:hypothetical protein
MRLAHHLSLAAGGLTGAALARWLGVPPTETLLLVAGAAAMALSVAAGFAEEEAAADEDRPAQGIASGSRRGMASAIASRLSQVAATQGRSLRSIRLPSTPRRHERSA